MNRKFKKLLLLPLKYIDEIRWARSLGVSIGSECRLYKVSFSTEPYLVEIGNHVSATKVHFETHDGGVWIFRKQHADWDKIKSIKIGNNVYIGYDTLVMPGVTIGNNVIIGAKSVVTKNIPDDTVAVGVPAKVIKSVDDYYEKIKSEVIPTKFMSSNEKMNFLLNKCTRK